MTPAWLGSLGGARSPCRPCIVIEGKRGAPARKRIASKSAETRGGFRHVRGPSLGYHYVCFVVVNDETSRDFCERI